MMSSINQKVLFVVLAITEALKPQQDFEKILIEIELALLLDSKPNLTRACRLLRPKTMAYWTDIFPHLND